MINKIKLLALSLVCISQVSYASIIQLNTNPSDSEADCSVKGATLTSVQYSNLDIDPLVPANTTGGAYGDDLLAGDDANNGYYSTDCRGLFDGNDDQTVTYSTGRNIGELNDGLLNGGSPYLNGLEFINPATDLLDIDGNGDATDPGWIHLGKFEDINDDKDIYDWKTNYSDITSYDNSKTINIGDVLELTFTCDPQDEMNDCKKVNWSLTTDKDIVDTVQDILGKSTFDHLAFSVKTGQNWAVYDFDFNQIFGNEIFGLGNNVFDFTTAYALSGQLSLGEDFGKGMSHINVYARDPAQITTTIPEPSTIAIFGLSLIGLSLRRKQA